MKIDMLCYAMLCYPCYATYFSSQGLEQTMMIMLQVFIHNLLLSNLRLQIEVLFILKPGNSSKTYFTEST